MCERQINSGCDHLRSYKEENGTKIYEEIIGNIVFPDLKEKFYENMKLLKMRCHALGCTCRYLLHVCMFCSTILCSEKHFTEHVLQYQHRISVDTTHGNTFCHLCHDYVYDDEFLTIADSLRQFSCESFGISYMPLTDTPLLKSDINLFLNTCVTEQTICYEPSSYVGIRGLVNHGTTCFMNVIFQAFAHIPEMRNYFFSIKHKCKLGHCFLCKMEKLFQEFYCGKTEPVTLGDMVELVWERAPHLAGDIQHDTHEFFIAALNLFHEDCYESNNQDPLNCPCLSHKLFTGQLQSKLVCSQCKNISTKLDPFWDISLEISAVEPTQALSIEQCLKDFTKSEVLDSKCTLCGSKGITKQMTFENLPTVVFFHLKRFKTYSKKNELIQKKVSTKIEFPPILDLRPFRSDYYEDQEEPDCLAVEDYEYELIAVINHDGLTMDVGHYTAYISQHKRWFHCDDTKLKNVRLEDALNSDAYLLAYEKRRIEYQ